MQGVNAPDVNVASAVEVAPLLATGEDGESTTIYVKNLAFVTTDTGLQVCFH